MNALLTAAELATILKVSVHTVYRMTDRDQIPSIKVGRFHRYDLDAVTEKLSSPAPSWAQSARSRGRKRVA